MESIKASKCLLYLKTTFELLKILPFCCLEQTKHNFETLNVAEPTQQLKEQSGQPGFFPTSSNHSLDSVVWFLYSVYSKLQLCTVLSLFPPLLSQPPSTQLRS